MHDNSFEDLLDRFSHDVLGVYAADKLLQKQNGFNFTEADLYEIYRERDFSDKIARQLFEEMAAMPIPKHMLSYHLRKHLYQE